MVSYTDMADELYPPHRQPPKGIQRQRVQKGPFVFTTTQITKSGLERPAGTYLSAELPQLDSWWSLQPAQVELLASQFARFLPQEGLVLVVGVGNRQVTADALGPRTAQGILATRGLAYYPSAAELGLREVAVISPGASGQTGIPLVTLVSGLVRSMKPSTVVCIDSLASISHKRLGKSIQMSDTGLQPARPASPRCLTRAMLGVPVLAVGMPTLMEHPQDSDLLLIPRQLDELIAQGSQLLAKALNRALQPRLTLAELGCLVRGA